MVPYAGAFDTVGRRALVAWDGTREAARAANDALPLLENAEAVTVMFVGARETALEEHHPSIERMVHHLQRHGIAARAEETLHGDLRISDVLLSRAADLAADLLVAGAYHNSQLREALVGGVSRELLEDTSYNVGALLERVFAIRHARGIGKYLVNGTHVNQPGGLLEAAVLTENITYASGAKSNTGVSADTGANSIGTPDLLNCYFGLNRAYRRESVWCMNDETFLAISNLLDQSGRPLVRYNNGLSEIATLYSRPIAICPTMPSIGVNATPVILYVPRYFLCRHVKAGSYVQMSTEHPGAVEFGAVSFQGWIRMDSALVVPSNAVPPVSILQNAS